MRIFLFLNVLVICSVFLPRIPLVVFAAGMMLFYCLVHAARAPVPLTTYKFFFAGAVMFGSYITWAVRNGKFDERTFVVLFTVWMLSYRFDTLGFTGAAKMSTRRKLMISTWNAPSEGNIYGHVSLDATNALKYIADLRAATGVHVTITHLVIKAIAMCMMAVPSVNGRLILGRYYPANSADVGCLVAMDAATKGAAVGGGGAGKGADLWNAKICNANVKTVAEIATELAARSTTLREGRDKDHRKALPMLALLPTFLIEPMVALTGWLASVGLSVPALGVSPYPFGTAMVTSMGMMGLDLAFVPHTPFAHVPLIVMVGAIAKKPAVDASGALCVREMLSLTVTIDHRFLDGFDGARMAKQIKFTLENPADPDAFGPPPPVSAAAAAAAKSDASPSKAAKGSSPSKSK